MKAKQILFNGESVLGILDGRKTQTRRVIRGPGNTWHIDRLLCDWDLTNAPYQYDGEEHPWRWRGKKEPQLGDWIWEAQTDVDDSATWPIRCPYGQADGLLWGRETWAAHKCFDEVKPSKIIKDTKKLDSCHPSGAAIYYKVQDRSWPWNERGKTRPSIFMPRWASRITLRVKRVWVERVQDISIADISAEGVHAQDYPDVAREMFAELWDSINAKRGFGWDVNPWVWCIDFEVVE